MPISSREIKKKLYLGNLEAKRDWGFAPEYVEAMQLMLQQEEPDDFVIGTGTSHSVREFVEKAFTYAGIEIAWQGKGTEEKGIIKSVSSELLSQITDYNLKAGNVVIEIDPRYFRPTDVEYLQADITKAREELGWEPRITFEELIKIMVDYDIKMSGLEPLGEGIAACKKKGFTYTNHDFSFYEKIGER